MESFIRKARTLCPETRQALVTLLLDALSAPNDTSAAACAKAMASIVRDARPHQSPGLKAGDMEPTPPPAQPIGYASGV